MSEEITTFSLFLLLQRTRFITYHLHTKFYKRSKIMFVQGVKQMRRRLRDWGVKIGRFPTGQRNLITDVKGITVGNFTLIKDEPHIARTGLTVIMPHEKDIYDENVFASTFVINGFGKSIGIIQIEEMGLLESPIVITTTLNVGKIADSLVSYMISKHRDLITFNPVVLECNDGKLNDSRRRWLGEKELIGAIEKLSEDFELGAVGAGTGMVAFGFKSGIGSSSRIVKNGNEKYTVGILTVPNFGRRTDLMIKGIEIGKMFEGKEENVYGSIIIIIATDAPLIPKQLKRLCVRATHGLARTGSRSTNHSGDVVLAFSNAVKLPRKPTNTVSLDYIPNDLPVFQDLMDAVVEATEEAILDALFMAQDMIGVNDTKYKALPVEQILKFLI